MFRNVNKLNEISVASKLLSSYLNLCTKMHSSILDYSVRSSGSERTKVDEKKKKMMIFFCFRQTNNNKRDTSQSQRKRQCMNAHTNNAYMQTYTHIACTQCDVCMRKMSKCWANHDKWRPNSVFYWIACYSYGVLCISWLVSKNLIGFSLVFDTPNNYWQTRAIWISADFLFWLHVRSANKVIFDFFVIAAEFFSENIFPVYSEEWWRKKIWRSTL